MRLSADLYPSYTPFQKAVQRYGFFSSLPIEIARKICAFNGGHLGCHDHRDCCDHLGRHDHRDHRGRHRHL